MWICVMLTRLSREALQVRTRLRNSTRRARNAFVPNALTSDGVANHAVLAIGNYLDIF